MRMGGKKPRGKPCTLRCMNRVRSGERTPAQYKARIEQRSMHGECIHGDRPRTGIRSANVSKVNGTYNRACMVNGLKYACRFMMYEL